MVELEWPLAAVTVALMESEAFKGFVHWLIGGLAAAACLYNGMEWTQRWEAHLALNCLIYLALWLFEFYQVSHHV